MQLENKYQIAILGAGLTGRGFIGRLIHESRFPFVLIDRNAELVKTLDTRAGYTVSFFENKRAPVSIDNFICVDTENPDIPNLLAGVRLFFISVGMSNLKKAGKWLAENTESARTDDGEHYKCTFILCENGTNPAGELRESFLSSLPAGARENFSKQCAFSEGVIFCTTIEDNCDPLNILSEDYQSIPCDARSLASNLPMIPALLPIEHFSGYLTRKLYTYNAASAIIAYIGWRKGYHVFAEAARDKEIHRLITDFFEQINIALCKEYGFDPEDQKIFAGNALYKFQNRKISDTIARNARDPFRKLGCNERIIGPAKLITKYGGNFDAMITAAACALAYEDPTDKDWKRRKTVTEKKEILLQASGLSESDELVDRILKRHRSLYKKKEFDL